MRRLFIALVILTPWITQSMEPQAASVETSTEEAGRWVRLVEEVLPGEIPLNSVTRIGQVIAQEVLRKRQQIKQYILSHISLPFKNFVGSGNPCWVRFNTAGDKLVTVSFQARVAEIWNGETGKRNHALIGHTAKVNSAVFNSAGNKIVTTSKDRTARIWDTATGTLLHTLEDAWSATFNPAGNKIVTISKDRTARIWDTATGTLLHTLEGAWSATFNPAGNKILTTSYDRTARIWDTATGTLLHILVGHTHFISSANFNPTGDKILTTSLDRTARIWDTETGNLLHILVGRPFGDVESAMFNRTGDKVVIVYSDGTDIGEARIWDIATGKLLHTLEQPLNIHSISNSMEAKFNPTGDKVVTVSYYGKAKIWDVETGRLLHTLEGRTHTVRLVEFKPNGDKIVTTSLDETMRIGDLEPLFSCQKFLTEDITHRQVAILLDIFHVIETQHYLKVCTRINFEKVALLKGLENITFDFNKRPHLWDEYNAIPEALRRIFDPYITKPSLEHDLKRLNCTQEQPSKGYHCLLNVL